jgi:hypothetical protein
VDNIYNIHRILKDRYRKYLRRIYWMQDKKRFRNAKYIYGWHLVEI